uniref:Nuclear factor of activated T-cells 5 n=1 Tax=Anopheles stephensi TaxID=30069 RepID=A0A182YQ42_ANOST
MQHSSSPVVRIAVAGSETLGSATNVKRKVPRLAGKRQPGKPFSVNLGATTSKQTCSRTYLGRTALPTAVGGGTAAGRLNRHGGVPPIVLTSATTNSDNSNDSGLGFDRSGSGSKLDKHHQITDGYVTLATATLVNCTGRQAGTGGAPRTSSNRASSNAPGPGPFRPAAGNDGSCVPTGTPTLTSSRDGKIQLQIVTQPEQQHRARYQTEGSRGAVKDRSGNGFPVVRLVGYNKPTALQVYIGSDVGRPSPHIFYQACKVSGKNSTPCVERNLNGTKYIEIQLKPENNMTVTCDCVGILKERNVDVEYRFPDQTASRTKKKSTRCRMVFRTTIVGDDGTTELLQVPSQQIICTQPPGVPEILKKSLTSCPVEGGLEMFIIGKNFLKDTRVVFQRSKQVLTHTGYARTAMQNTTAWEQSVIPDKEHLNQVHLICVVPPYERQDITEPVTIKMYIVSSGKKSETHDFVYTPKGDHTTLSAATVSAPARRTRINTVGQQLQRQQQLQQPQQQSQPATHNYISELAAAAIGNGSGMENSTTGANADTALAVANANAAINAIAATVVASSAMGELPGPNGTAGRFVCNGNRTEGILIFRCFILLDDIAVSPFDDSTVCTNRPMFLRTSTTLEIAAKGMMPPPINLLQPISGASAASIIQPQCHSGLTIGGANERAYAVSLSSPQPTDVFKPELVEPECSRSDMVEEDSLDQFPASAENSLDGIMFGPVPNEASILYRRRSVRQPSMEMEDSSSNMSLLANDSRMMDAPPAGGASGGSAGGGGTSSSGSLSIGSHFDTLLNMVSIASYCGNGGNVSIAPMETNYMGSESLDANKTPLPLETEMKNVLKTEPLAQSDSPVNMQLSQLMAQQQQQQQQIPAEKMDVGMVASTVVGLLMDTTQLVQQPMDTSAPLSAATVMGAMGVQLGGGGVVVGPGTGELPPVSNVSSVESQRIEVQSSDATSIAMDSIGLNPAQVSLAEESRVLASELTAMSETELMNYICPSAFDSGK